MHTLRSLSLILGSLGVATGCADEPIRGETTVQAGGELACEPVRVFDTHGSDDEELWTEVSATAPYAPANVRDLVLDNGLVRVTYEFLNEDQEGSHSLYLHRENGLARVTSNWYGDYTYWVSTITDPATSATITQNSGGLAEVAYVFDHSPDAPWVQDMQLVKSVALRSCHAGMFVKFAGSPSNVPGEREFGIGEGLPLNFSGQAVGLHPFDGRHVNLGLFAGDAHLPWAAGLGNDGILRTLVLRRPMATLAYQFDPNQYGRVVVNQFVEEPGDGYQAFLGAEEFEPADLAVIEAEGDAGHIAEDPSASGGLFRTINPDTEIEFEIDIPLTGTYALWLRSRSYYAAEVQVGVGEATWTTLYHAKPDFAPDPLGELLLGAGSHRVRVHTHTTTLDVDALIIVPVGRARETAAAALARFGQ